jgi:hypothetical protein
MTTWCRGYEVETKVLKDEYADQVGLEACIDLATKLFEHFNVPPIEVKHARSDAQRSWYWHPTRKRPARIHLSPNRGCNPATICHEVAHHVGRLRGSKGHDRLWASIYVLAVEHALGDATASRLRDGFREIGLLAKRRVAA